MLKKVAKQKTSYIKRYAFNTGIFNNRSTQHERTCTIAYTILDSQSLSSVNSRNLRGQTYTRLYINKVSSDWFQQKRHRILERGGEASDRVF